MHKSVGAVFCFFVLFCFLVQTLMFLEIMQEHTEAARDREREREAQSERERERSTPFLIDIVAFVRSRVLPTVRYFLIESLKVCIKRTTQLYQSMICSTDRGIKTKNVCINVR